MEQLSKLPPDDFPFARGVSRTNDERTYFSKTHNNKGEDINEKS